MFIIEQRSGQCISKRCVQNIGGARFASYEKGIIKVVKQVLILSQQFVT